MSIAAAAFQGSISGNTLTITGTVTGTVAIGQTLISGSPGGQGVTPGQFAPVGYQTAITAGSGTSWTVRGPAQTVAAQSMLSYSPNIENDLNGPPTGTGAGSAVTSGIYNPPTHPTIDLLLQIATLQSTGNSPAQLVALQNVALDSLMAIRLGMYGRLAASSVYSTMNIATLLTGQPVVTEIANWTAQALTLPGGESAQRLDQKYQEAIRLAIKLGLTTSAAILASMS